MSWVDDYKTKLRSAEAAVGCVKSGDRVYYGGNAAIPQTLVRVLAQRRDELTNVQLNHVLLVGDDPLSVPGMEGHFRHNSLFVGPADRKAINEGRADYVPIFLHQIPGLFLSGQMPLDVAILHVSPPDEHGFCSFGGRLWNKRAFTRVGEVSIVSTATPWLCAILLMKTSTPSLQVAAGSTLLTVTAVSLVDSASPRAIETRAALLIA